ncbi:MAG: dihydrolipoyl dehydrogenase [Betaproteobacteria bacterium]|nr:dihydrolipoyl dehydrogenase [Betaproteobacteria bacterium]
MKQITTEVAVIGAGTAGLAAHHAAVAAGSDAVLVEAGPFGTTCARVGCMPSKLLVAAAEAVHATGRLGTFGIDLPGTPVVDGPAVMARVRRERDRFVSFVISGVDDIPARQRIVGTARFLDDHTLELDGDRRVRFRSAVIATGSSPTVLPFLKAAGDRLIVNDDVFAWTDLPGSVAVFGPGVIGLELGQALHRLGVRVTLFGKGGFVGPITDPEVLDYAYRTFASEFPLHPDADVRALERTDAGVRIDHAAADGAPCSLTVDHVIAATGRTPNLHRLKLRNTSLALDHRGIPLFDRETLRCGHSNIFIAGDVNDDLPLLHEAADEGRIAGDNAARFPQSTGVSRRAPLNVVFSDPQIAIVGRGFADLDPGRTVRGRVSFEDQGRARMILRNRGLLHLYVDADTRRFAGLEMIGPDAEHLAHLAAWALQAGLTVDDMLAMPFYHPVVEEGLRTALRDAREQLDGPPRVRPAA